MQDEPEADVRLSAVLSLLHLDLMLDEDVVLLLLLDHLLVRLQDALDVRGEHLGGAHVVELVLEEDGDLAQRQVDEGRVGVVG